MTTDGGAGDDDGPDDGGPDDGGPVEPAAGGEPRKRRRRRRRRGGGEAGADVQAADANRGAQPAQGERPPGEPPAREERPRGGEHRGEPRARPPGEPPAREERPRGGEHRGGEHRGGDRNEPRRNNGPEARDRGARDRGARDGNDRPRGGRPNRGERRDARPSDDDHGDPTTEAASRDPLASRDRAEPLASPDRAAPAEPAGDDDDAAPAPNEAWGTDDGAPAKSIALAPDLPAEPADDDPASRPVADGPTARLGDDVASVVGVRFVPAGRISWFDAGDGDFHAGDRVVVDSDRGTRLAWIAAAPQRRLVQSRSLRRVIRRANDADLRGEQTDIGRASALRIAKDKAAALRLPLKVFRVESGAGKLVIYYTSDDRLDLRDFTSGVAQATGLRPELRQLGVRDEAKAVGGIGTCGLALCCTTWLPEFVPVSIKMAKDQGLVLSPTKVSGQCGRLKCCLVYEQAAYAELRKGLPKLGKRVIGARGEGRVVEVDVLRQRVRVSYGPGDTEVVPATEVKPMFPSGGGRQEQESEESETET